jgi:hypothetical protein
MTQVGGNLVTNGLLVAVVILTHIQIAAFLIGASTLAIISEAMAITRSRRGAGGLGDARHDRLSHGLVKSSVLIFSFGSALAIFFLVFVLGAVWGRFFVALQQITFWTFFLEALAFVAEIVLLYTLYANWQRLAQYRRARLGMLVLLNLAQWFQMWFIDVVASFMMTPNGGDVNYLNQLLNPTQIPLDIHRTIGNIALAGAFVAGYGAFKYLRATRRLETARRAIPRGVPAASVGAMSAAALAAEPHEAAEARYWDWVAQWGAVFLIGLTLLQPWVGYSYAKEVQLHAYPSWFDMMLGSLSNLFLAQITILGTMFTLGAVYFWRRMKAVRASHFRRQGFIAILLGLTTVFAAQPAWFAWTYGDVVAQNKNFPFWQGGLINPFGYFIPYKIGALLAMMFFGLWSLTSYMRAYSREEVPSGRTGRKAQYTLIVLAVLTSLMMMVMGVIREHARQPYLINGELTIQNQQITNNQPSPLGGSSGQSGG